jgi:hypothetical protein
MGGNYRAHVWGGAMRMGDGDANRGGALRCPWRPYIGLVLSSRANSSANHPSERSNTGHSPVGPLRTASRLRPNQTRTFQASEASNRAPYRVTVCRGRAISRPRMTPSIDHLVGAGEQRWRRICRRARSRLARAPFMQAARPSAKKTSRSGSSPPRFSHNRARIRRDAGNSGG